MRYLVGKGGYHTKKYMVVVFHTKIKKYKRDPCRVFFVVQKRKELEGIAKKGKKKILT